MAWCVHYKNYTIMESRTAPGHAVYYPDDHSAHLKRASSEAEAKADIDKLTAKS